MADSFRPPIEPNRYRVEEIQHEKHDEEPRAKEPVDERPRRFAFFAYLFLAFKKFIDLFQTVSEQGLATSAEDELHEHLVDFKAVLELLKDEDHSQDPAFLNHFSETWHHLLRDASRFRRPSALSEQINLFIKEIQRYPEHIEHSLGYYLTEYAGAKWLPFPYMEMILRLHTNHSKNPSASLLSRWTEELNALIALLIPEPK